MSPLAPHIATLFKRAGVEDQEIASTLDLLGVPVKAEHVPVMLDRHQQKMINEAMVEKAMLEKSNGATLNGIGALGAAGAGGGLLSRYAWNQDQ